MGSDIRRQSVKVRRDYFCLKGQGISTMRIGRGAAREYSRSPVEQPAGLTELFNQRGSRAVAARLISLKVDWLAPPVH